MDAFPFHWERKKRIPLLSGLRILGNVSSPIILQHNRQGSYNGSLQSKHSITEVTQLKPMGA